MSLQALCLSRKASYAEVIQLSFAPLLTAGIVRPPNEPHYGQQELPKHMSSLEPLEDVIATMDVLIIRCELPQPISSDTDIRQNKAPNMGGSLPQNSYWAEWCLPMPAGRLGMRELMAPTVLRGRVPRAWMRILAKNAP